jgi:hypothetical protein
VRSKVLVSLLVTGVLGDEVEVLSADDQGSVHLGGNDGAGEDTASDRDHTGEWAFLVCGRKMVRLDSLIHQNPMSKDSVVVSVDFPGHRVVTDQCMTPRSQS